MSTMFDLFQTKIDYVRNILRREGITGMDSMKHCALYLAARYMTLERCTRIGIPTEFAWESLFALVHSSDPSDKERSRDLIYSAEADCLVTHFDSLFRTTEFNFRATARGHADIMEGLDPVQLDEIVAGVDLLGWVYEAHMKTSKGSSGGSRDLGQHFTDRPIIEYMMKLCDPKKFKSGTIDTICDPSMGTGGMLTTAIRYLTEKYGMTPADWELNKDRLFGYDIDRFLGSVASINAFMESHGTVFPHISHRDSLHSDIGKEKVVHGEIGKEKVDVIVANMPFGVKGLKFADCCQRVKDLKIDGTKSEPLFLQLMMVALAKKGRCAVVVPDGLLINTSKCHDGTRKYLLDHFELHRVIKMKGKFFMNTGIQPSILFFENTGKPTKAVEFWEVTKEDSGTMTENLLVTVPREKFDAGCVLDSRRYVESDKPAVNPAGFPTVKLGDIAFNKKYPQHDTSYGKETGCRRFHTGGVSTFLYTDTPDISETIIIVNRTNGAGKSNIFLDSNCSVAKQTLILSCENDITTKYLFYWLSLNKPEIEKGYIGSNHKNLSNDYVKNMKMPLPPLPVQETIVATLDRIFTPGTTELADTLKLTSQAMDLVLADPTGATLTPVVEAQRLIRKSAQMVADVKAQMVADVKTQMVAIIRASSAQGEERKITEVATLKHGFPFKSSDFTTEGLAVVKHNNITDGFVSKSKKQDFIPIALANDYQMSAGDIVVSMDFDCGKVGKIMENDWVLNQRVCRIKSGDEAILSQDYLYWVLRFGGFYEKMQGLQTGTTIKHISGKHIESAVIRVPSIAYQTAVVARLDALQSQLNALESLQRQSEDNARFILESYLGGGAVAETGDDASTTEEETGTIEHVD